MDAKTENSEVVAARVPRDLARRIRAAAADQQLTTSKWLAQLLAAAVAATER